MILQINQSLAINSKFFDKYLSMHYIFVRKLFFKFFDIMKKSFVLILGLALLGCNQPKNQEGTTPVVPVEETGALIPVETGEVIPAEEIVPVETIDPVEEMDPNKEVFPIEKIVPENESIPVGIEVFPIEEILPVEKTGLPIEEEVLPVEKEILPEE